MKILSIDFDIIMGPSIGIYNNFVEPPEDTADDYLKMYKFLEPLPADLNVYEYLTRILISNAAKKVPIYFIDGHEQIIPLLQEWNEPEVEVINIDHHHDIKYGEKIMWGIKAVTYHCGSWVKYGMDNNLIHSYTWIHNPNSSFPEKRGMDRYLKEEMEVKDFCAPPKDIDIIVVCASPEWIPSTYQPLLATWKTICEEAGYEFHEIEKSENL